MDCYLIEVTLKEVQKGRKVDYTFNNQAGIDMLILLEETIALQHDKFFLNRDSFHGEKNQGKWSQLMLMFWLLVEGDLSKKINLFLMSVWKKVTF